MCVHVHVCVYDHICPAFLKNFYQCGKQRKKKPHFKNSQEITIEVGYISLYIIWPSNPSPGFMFTVNLIDTLKRNLYFLVELVTILLDKHVYSVWDTLTQTLFSLEKNIWHIYIYITWWKEQDIIKPKRAHTECKRLHHFTYAKDFEKLIS